MKNRDFWDGTGKVLLIIALLIGSLSLVMNLSSRYLEKSASERLHPSSTPENTTVINILAAGSADFGTQSVSTANYEDAFGGIWDLVSNYDVAVYSQRTLVGTDVPTSFADEVIGKGFNLVALANPTALIHGKEGIDSSLAYWSTKEVHTAGTYDSTAAQNSIKTFDVDGMTVAFLSFTETTDYEVPESEAYLINLYDPEKTPELIQKADDVADVVIVSIDWDGTDLKAPSAKQKEMAKAMADAGASVIIGNVPDSIQPVAWIDDTLIFYSMGNLISDAKEEQDHYGLLGAVTITKTVQGNKQKIELFNPRVDLCKTVVDDSNGYSVVMLNRMTEEDQEDIQDVKEQYTSLLLSMDDSIRIGGLE